MSLIIKKGLQMNKKKLLEFEVVELTKRVNELKRQNSLLIVGEKNKIKFIKKLIALGR